MTRMQAAYVTRTGGPEVLEYTEVEAPVAGPGQVLVKVAAAGVNFIDIYLRTGVYPRPLPAVPGGEGAGTVEAIGAGVEGLAVGDRVAWADGNVGSYAEYDVVFADRLVHVPDGVDLETAAASMLQGMTAHYLTNSTWPLKAGDTALVHAAAGGMGLLLSQIGKAKGARVIGTTSTAAKAALAREAGADAVINYAEGPTAAAWTWSTTASARPPSTPHSPRCARAACWRCTAAPRARCRPSTRRCSTGWARSS